MFARTGWVLLLACFTCGCADQWLLYPSTQPIDAQGVQRRIFTSDGRKIELFVAQSAGVGPGQRPKAYLLEFTGNSTRAEATVCESAEMCGQRPVEIWTMNYAGFGGSDGPASLQLIPKTALAAYDELHQHADGRPIFIKGYSMGTTAALYVASQRPTAGMILQSPPPLQREIMWHHGWWNLWIVASITTLEIPGELNSLDNAPKVTAPAVFLISGKDRLVPPNYQQMVFDAYAGPKHRVVRAEARHNTLLEIHDPTIQNELDWLFFKGQPSLN